MEWINEHPGWFTLILSVGVLIFFAGRWVGGMNDFKSTLGSAVVDIKNSITTIQNDIKTILGALPPPTVSRTSPLSLTDFGKQISKEVKAGIWAEDMAGRLVGRVQDKKPFEIQEFCFKFVKGAEFKPTEETSNAIRESAYNHGTKIDDIKDVFVVELRDSILKLLNLDPPP